MGIVIPAFEYRTDQQKPAQFRDSFETLVNKLRKSFGEASDSPTLGYYRELPYMVAREAVNKSVGMANRGVTETLLGVAGFWMSAGSLAFGGQILGGVFAAATVALGADAVRTHYRQERFKQDIMDRKLG